MEYQRVTALVPSVLALLVASSAHAVVQSNTDFGTLSMGGDVEYNVNAANTSPGNVLGKSDRTDRWDEDGRLLLSIKGVRDLPNGHYGEVLLQPTVGTNGGASADDASLTFGVRKDWAVKVGRFEAYDMFPLGQDIFVEHSGDSANDLYTDGHGYIYMLKEGRGRAGKGGQLLVNKETGNWYMEVAGLVGDRSNLFKDEQYHGYDVTKEKDSLILRPVLAWKGEKLKVAIGGEANVIRDALVIKDSSGNEQSISKRVGYGVTTTWTASDSLAFNFNAARMDAEDETDTTLGANTVWQNLGLGYIFAINDIKDANVANTSADFSAMIGKHKIHTTYASYKFPSVLGLTNFDIYLGAYWSQLQPDSDKVDNMDRYGGRVRFKYFF